MLHCHSISSLVWLKTTVTVIENIKVTAVQVNKELKLTIKLCKGCPQPNEEHKVLQQLYLKAKTSNIIFLLISQLLHEPLNCKKLLIANSQRVFLYFVTPLPYIKFSSRWISLQAFSFLSLWQPDNSTLAAGYNEARKVIHSTVVVSFLSCSGNISIHRRLQLFWVSESTFTTKIFKWHFVKSFFFQVCLCSINSKLRGAGLWLACSWDELRKSVQWKYMEKKITVSDGLAEASNHLWLLFPHAADYTVKMATYIFFCNK